MVVFDHRLVRHKHQGVNAQLVREPAKSDIDNEPVERAVLEFNLVFQNGFGEAIWAVFQEPLDKGKAHVRVSREMEEHLAALEIVL